MTDTLNTGKRAPGSPTPPPPLAQTYFGSVPQDLKVASPLLQGSQTAVYTDDPQRINPTYSHQMVLHASNPSDLEKRQQSNTLPARQQHYYEEADDVVAAAKSEKKKSHKKSKKEKATNGAEKTSQSAYDKLSDVRPVLSSVPEERGRAQTDNISGVISLERRERSSERRSKSPSDSLQQVELRHKPHSPPSIVEPDSCCLDKGNRSWTPSEIKQVRKLRHEALINDSPVTHERRRALYTHMKLPGDSGANPSRSRDSSGSDSDTSSLVATPSTTEFVDGNQTYDIPTAMYPAGLSATAGGENMDCSRTPSPIEQHYSVPSSTLAHFSRSPSPSSPHTNPYTTYDVPKSCIQHASSSTPKKVPQMPLPHLPDDYVNITLKTLPAKLMDDQVYMNVEKDELNGDDVYSEIPANVVVRGSGTLQLPHDKQQPPQLGASKADLYNNLADIKSPSVPSNHQPQLGTATGAGFQQLSSEGLMARKSETLARKLANEGYEFVQPANTPVVTSPKCSSPPTFSGNGQGNSLTDEYIVMQGPSFAGKATSMSKTPPALLDGDNEYVTVKKQGQVPADVAAAMEKPYVNTPPRSRRRKDGYDEITTGVIPTSRVHQAQQSQTPEDNMYTNPSVALGPTSNGVTGGVGTKEGYVNVPDRKQKRSREGYDEVDVNAVRYSPTRTRAQPSSANTTMFQSQETGLLGTQSESSPKLLKKQFSSDIGDLVEADVLEDSTQLAGSGLEEDEYVFMRPQRKHSSSSNEEKLSPDPPPVRANGNKPIPIKVPTTMDSPTAETVANRKRSLTAGNALDSPSNSKKHPYENVGDQTVVLSSPPTALELSLSKKPMPLPRPSGMHPNKFPQQPVEQEGSSPSPPKTIARVQSKPVLRNVPTAESTGAAVRRTNSQ